MSLSKRKPGGNWQSCLPHPVIKGKYVRRSMKTSNKRLAQQRERELQKKLWNAEKSGIVEPEKVLFENLCVEYVAIAKPGNMPQTKRRDKVSMKNLKRFFSGMFISDITRKKVEQYMAMRTKEYVPNRKEDKKKLIDPRTINIEVTCLNSMLNKAVDWGYLSMNPIKGIKKLRVDPRPPMVLSKQQERLLLKFCPYYTRPIVIFALNTGMRISEILRLQWSHVFWEQRLLIFGKSKTHVIRRVPINDTALALLKELKDEADGRTVNKEYVFVKPNYEPFGNIKIGFKNACRKAGIPNFRFHYLRATFASRFLSKPGNNLEALRLILGHKDIKTTVIYCQFADSHLLEAVKRLDNDTNLTHDVPVEQLELAKC